MTEDKLVMQVAKLEAKIKCLERELEDEHIRYREAEYQAEEYKKVLICIRDFDFSLMFKDEADDRVSRMIRDMTFRSERILEAYEEEDSRCAEEISHIRGKLILRYKTKVEEKGYEEWLSKLFCYSNPGFRLALMDAYRIALETGMAVRVEANDVVLIDWTENLFRNVWKNRKKYVK
ncbi:MAG: hypothetical protein J6B56_06105 [Clostridia bacterium]|nr:hypothetical protein [Clostridia bacterium]